MRKGYVVHNRRLRKGGRNFYVLQPVKPANRQGRHFELAPIDDTPGFVRGYN